MKVVQVTLRFDAPGGVETNVREIARRLKARGEDVRVFAVVTGIEGVFMQTVYVTAMYDHTRIVSDAQFVDMLTPLSDGRTLVDLRKLSDVTRVDARADPG